MDSGVEMLNHAADLLSVDHDFSNAVSPGGSPLTHRKLIDFLNVNGNFNPDAPEPSSNASTASSSLCPTPLPPCDETDEFFMQNQRRLSLSPYSESVTPPNELKLIKNECQMKTRRHSVVTPIQSDKSENDVEISSAQGSPTKVKLTDKTLIKIDNIIPAQIDKDDKIELGDETVNYYPNCDVNVWLRSCEKEIIEPVEGIVKGTIPKWINGSLLRNGPGNLKVGDMEYKHLFDSSALLHRFGIRNGKVTYQCRFLQSEIYKTNQAAKRIVISEFGTSAVPDPCQSIFSKIATLFTPGENITDNALISIYPIGDEYFTFTETPAIHQINPITLETVKRINLYKSIGIVNHTAHLHTLPDGKIYNLGMIVKKTGPHYIIMEFPNDSAQIEKSKIIATLPVRWKLHPGYMHSFGITTNYFVIVEQPMTVSVGEMVRGRLTNKPLSTALKWFPDQDTHIYLLDRATGELKYTFYSEAFFYLHIINQYEQEDHVILDICCYKNPEMLNCMYIETMRKMASNPNYAKLFRGRPLRFVMPLVDSKSIKKTKLLKMDCQNIEKAIIEDRNNNSVSGSEKMSTRRQPNKNLVSDNLVTLENSKAEAYKLMNKKIYCKPESLCELGCETPRINYENYLAKPYQYFYAISSDVDGENPGTIIKIDVRNKTTQSWSEKNVYPSEPIFVPHPNSSSEDDGVILSAIVWGNEIDNRVGLLVLCAKTWRELGRCEFETYGPSPKCLHGWFAPSKE